MSLGMIVEKPMVGVEPTTPALRKRCSAIELHRRWHIDTQVYQGITISETHFTLSFTSNKSGLRPD